MSACASMRLWTALLLLSLGCLCSTVVDDPTLQEEVSHRLEVMRAALLRGPDKNSSGYFISNSDFGVHFTVGGIRQSIPLVAVNIEVRMVDMIAEVVLEQIFANPYNSSVIDCEYAFPMDSRAVLKDLIVTIGDRKILGRVEEKRKARELYEQAVAAGESAFLVQQQTDMLDVFTCSLGNLNPNDTTKVQLTYLMSVDDEGYRQGDKVGDDYAFRLVVPMAVAPRYTSINSNPTMGSYNMGEAIQLRGLLRIEGSVTTSSPLLNISTLTQNNFLSELGGGHVGKFRMVASSLDGDLVVVITTKDRYRTRIFYQDLLDGNKAMIVRYRPDMEKLLAQDTKKEVAKDVEDEYIFIIDRSGSMEGADMRDAAQALALFTSSLPQGSKFNIIGFGSTYEILFPEVTSTRLTDASKAVAMRHCELLQADLGGTEILAPVQFIGRMPKTDGRRIVIVLTDGQVFNTAEVLSEVNAQNRINGTRYFSVGIGHGTSTALVKGIAENGEGESEFVVPGERIQAKVMRQMERMTRPSISKVQLKPPAGSTTILGPFPECRKELSYYSPAIFHLIFKPDPAVPLTFSIASELPSGEHIIETFELGPGHAIPLNSFLHSSIDSLVAKAAIAQLEGEEPMDIPRIVKISKEYNVASQHASFLAVEIKDKVPVVAGGVKKTQLRGGYLSPIRAAQQAFYPMSGASVMMASASGSGPPLMASDMMTESAVYSSAPRMKSSANMFSMRSAPDVAASGVANSISEAQSCTLADQSNSLHFSLVSQQRIAGGWDMDEKVIRTIGLTGESVLQTLPTNIPGVTPEVWLTALVLAALQLKSAEYIEEWRMASAKALRWIKNSIDTSYVQTLLDAAVAEISVE